MIKKFLFACVTSFLMVFGFAVNAPAQNETSPSSFPNVKIRNFGQMDERFYRGAQPMPDDFQALKDLGIKTVIDLRNDPTEYEKAAVEALGMRYVNIPMSGWKSPKDHQLEAFMKLANDPETGAFFVHCKAGIHRTGVAGAVYRFTKYGWNYDQAYKEMKNYDFSTGLVHGALKSYVRDYYKDIETGKVKVNVLREAAAAGTAQ
jgi:protein tyrosine/serine phosphatase